LFDHSNSASRTNEEQVKREDTNATKGAMEVLKGGETIHSLGFFFDAVELRLLNMDFM
jgi:hypothetical protein